MANSEHSGPPNEGFINEGFINEPVAVSQLPRLSDEHFSPVDPNYLRVSLLGYALLAVIATVAGILVTLLDNDPTRIPLLVLVIVLLLISCAVVFRILDTRTMAYQVRTHDISYRSGVLIKQVATVPFVRVQHARIRQGPLQRRFGIATLDVNSAGPDLAIRGLATDTAEQLKMLVVERAGDLVEDE